MARRVALLLSTLLLVAGASAVAAAPSALAATTLTVAPTSLRPTEIATVTGTGFGASEAVDVYLDTTAVRLVVSKPNGTITTTVTVPAAIEPGTHWVTAVGRSTGGAAQASIVVTTPWSQAAFDLRKTGNNAYENTITPATVKKAKEAWGTDLGNGGCVSVIVADGVVYGITCGGIVYAVSAVTGVVKWTTDAAAGGANYTAPTLVNATLYFGVGPGTVYALNSRTGAVRWANGLTINGMFAPVTVTGGLVYAGAEDGSLTALDSATGAVVWTTNVGGQVRAAPVVAGGRLFVASSDFHVRAFDAPTGTLLWTGNSSAWIRGGVIVQDGRVLGATDNGRLICLRARDGGGIYNIGGPAGNSYLAAAAYVDGLLIVSGPFSVYAFHYATGAQAWTIALADSGRETLNSVVTAGGGLVYVGDEVSSYVLDASTGALVRTIAAPLATNVGWTVSDGALYVHESPGTELRRYDLRPQSPAAVRHDPAQLSR